MCKKFETEFNVLIDKASAHLITVNQEEYRSSENLSNHYGIINLEEVYTNIIKNGNLDLK